jgi:hypothetical protein
MVHRTIVVLLSAGLLGITLAGRGYAQAPEMSFEPGEIIIGYKSQADRELAIQKLTATKDSLSIRGKKVAKVRIQREGISAIKLQIDLPADLRGQANSDPEAELRMLYELASQIKNGDDRVKYIHPNWIVKGQSS